MSAWGDPGRGYPRSRRTRRTRDPLLSAFVAIPLGMALAYLIRWAVHVLAGL